MGTWSGRAWWSSLGLGKPAADDGDDFGDMGTAFGLDASMAGDTEATAQGADDRFDAQATVVPGDRLKRRTGY